MREAKICRIAVTYSGRVQGVGFRATTVSLVSGAPIVGWVRNDPDGTVSMEAQATEEILRQFLARIDHAMGLKIQHRTVQWIEPEQGEKRFTILYQ